MTTTATARLTAGPIGPGLLRLTLPMVLGISSSLLAGLAETYYLGLLGSTELAALGFTFPVTSGLMSLTLGVSIGLSSVLAREVGAGNQLNIKTTATGGLTLASLVMVIVSILGLLSTSWLFTALGANEQTLPLVTEYMQLWYLSLLFMAIPSVGANALRATGDAKISGYLMVAGSVLQVILAPVFIFGLLGLPELGMTGAALGNLIARILMCCVTLYILVNRYQLIQFRGVDPKALLQAWRSILVVSIPATATNLIGPVSSAFIVSLLAGYGQSTVAGFAIANRVEGLFVIPLFALSASIGPFVGQNFGAKAHDRADAAMRLSFRWSLYWGLGVALALYFIAEPLVHIFDKDPQVAKVAILYLMVVPISFGTWGVIMMASAIFNALGYPLRSTLISIFRMLIIYVPLAFILSNQWDVFGIFLAGAAANIISALIAYLWNRKTFIVPAKGATSLGSD
ncbi:MAG: MATE family efflux transporter [Pseudomonadales bacterium]